MLRGDEAHDRPRPRPHSRPRHRPRHGPRGVLPHRTIWAVVRRPARVGRDGGGLLFIRRGAAGAAGAAARPASPRTRSPRPSGMRRPTSSTCPRGRTWGSRAGTRRRWRRSGRARWCWTWAPAAGLTASSLGREGGGAGGRVIGVDMTPDMLSKARRNIAVPIASARASTTWSSGWARSRASRWRMLSVDVVISNCVLNLSPDKPRVWREIARVLRPGGRVAVSDLALLRPLPEAVRERYDALVGCIAGAVAGGGRPERSDARGRADRHHRADTTRPQYIEGDARTGQDPLHRKDGGVQLPEGTKPRRLHHQPGYQRPQAPRALRGCRSLSETKWSEGPAVAQPRGLRSKLAQTTAPAALS
jgi:SAM-dependent methyltransferase